MSYAVRIPGPVRKKIASWGLPDALLVEVYLRLTDELARNPSLHLVRAEEPFDGMVYRFSLIDPENRLCEHFCIFHVLYGQVEATLEVVNFVYLRRVG